MKNLLATTLDQNANVQKVSVFGVNYNELKAINQTCLLASSSNVNLFSDPNSDLQGISCNAPHSVALSHGIFDDTIVSVTPVDGQNVVKIVSNYAVSLDFESLSDAEHLFSQLPFISRIMPIGDSMRFWNDKLVDDKTIEFFGTREIIVLNDGGHAFLTTHSGKNTVTITSSSMRFLPPEMKID